MIIAHLVNRFLRFEFMSYCHRPSVHLHLFSKRKNEVFSSHFNPTIQYIIKSDICKTCLNFSVPDDQNRGNAFWRSRGRSLRRTPWWHGRITFRGRHGWDVWWGRVWRLQLWSRCQASPMSTMSEDIFVQPSIGPAHVCFLQLTAIILFCSLNDKYLLTFQTGAHWRKALQMLILRS